ncbi:protein phosphatase 2C domain-containing protein [Salinibacterium sp. SYSU T00001]|uniref:PP2C family protein-serine/threonine phosphatase n=1 Tax=Homoserinimonas sedimenticola TaxID=2986805 RepID=UPI0022356086|nr:protein phosphatase 2C domain-containing protein [Salinibacterium sedimenticola]MCW4384925.1 protein phosphatase 2C domain-containing protein [Salinibacterium sedimenticola]
MTPFGAELSLDVSYASDVGRVRSVNEDSLLASPPLFLVADGMGGHAYGDRASQTVVSVFTTTLGTDDAPSPESVVATIHSANDAVIGLREPDDVSVSGTTLAGLALVTTAESYRWMVFNVGDSRVYRWDGRHLSQVTVDHSAVQELLDAGEITPLEALTHPHRNVVTRAIGVHDEADVDVWLLPVTGEQTFLICSDGLTKELADDQIARLLADHAPDASGQSVSERLVEAALAAGGSDNVSVVVVASSMADSASEADDDTNDGGISSLLEETRPRK